MPRSRKKFLSLPLLGDNLSSKRWESICDLHDSSLRKNRPQNKKKKEKNDICNVRRLFDELPEHLKIDILRRLPTKSVAGFACVSKSWLYLITTYCFPKTTTNSRLLFAGLIQRLEIVSRDPKTNKLNSPQTLPQVEFVFCRTDNRDSVPDKVFHTLPFSVNHHTYLLDCCNGLHLFFHPIKPKPAPRRLYSYSVFNVFSGQCATIGMPTKVAIPMYAALAYDPSKSSFYRVVQFDQGFRCLNVYNSKMRRWKKLEFWLENDVSKAEWLENQSVFFQGAIYRLSMSGHLLRFMVDQEVSLKDQAQAINLPEVANELCLKGYCLGLSNDQINFTVFDRDSFLCIWVLSRESYEWSLRHRLSGILEKDYFKNNFCRPLGFHPYLDIVFVGSISQGLKSSIMHINFGKPIGPENQTYVYNCPDGFLINGHHFVTFPLFKCPVPFANGTKEHSTDDFSLEHVDKVIDYLLRRILPSTLPCHRSRKRKRLTPKSIGTLEPRKSALKEDFEEEDRGHRTT